MKKLLLGLGLAVVLVAAYACSGDSASTPTSTPTALTESGLETVIEEAKSPVKVCHYNPFYNYYDPFEFHVVEIDSPKSVQAHCANHNGNGGRTDFTQSGQTGCPSCAGLNSFPVGANCGYCYYI